MDRLKICVFELMRWGIDLRNANKLELKECQRLVKDFRGSRLLSDANRFIEAKLKFHGLLRDQEVRWR